MASAGIDVEKGAENLVSLTIPTHGGLQGIEYYEEVARRFSGATTYSEFKNILDTWADELLRVDRKIP